MTGKSVEEETIVYEEFEPLCKWQRNEDRDVLEVHLQDFKKEQLKVQISNHGVLKISGERQIDSSKRAKFYKEVPAPNTKYDTLSIHAKFVNNILFITLPKPKPSDNIAPSLPSGDQSPKTRFAAAAALPGGRQEQTKPHLGGNASTVDCRLQSCRKKDWMGSGLGKVAASLAATVAAIVVLAAYVHFIYKSTVDEGMTEACFRFE